MRFNKNLFFILYLLSFGLYTPAVAEEQTITIQADRASINDNTRVTLYEGNVEVQQGGMRIKADKVSLTYDKEKQVETIVAEGHPAHFYRPAGGGARKIRAEAKRMEYHAQQDMLHLSRNAKIWQGTDSFSGERIVYDARRAIITADGGGEKPGRVNVVIKPKEKLKEEKAENTSTSDTETRDQ